MKDVELSPFKWVIRRCCFAVMILTSANKTLNAFMTLDYFSVTKQNHTSSTKKAMTDGLKLLLNALGCFLDCIFHLSARLLESFPLPKLRQNFHTHIIYQYTMREGWNPSNFKTAKLSDLKNPTWQYRCNVQQNCGKNDTEMKFFLKMMQNQNKIVVCLAKKKTAHSFTCKQNRTHFPPHCFTDHGAGSVRSNILFVRVYRCALQRWCPSICGA